MDIYHIHHITPKHMGGTDEPSNLIRLSIQEHAEAHRTLYEKYGNWQDHIAWKALSGQINPKQAQAEAVSRALTGKKQSPEHVSKRTYKGIKRKQYSEERKQKLSDIMIDIGHAPSKSARDNAAKTNTGSFWVTNGVNSKKLHKGDQIPIGWKKGRVMKPLL